VSVASPTGRRLTLATPAGRWVLTAAILGSGMAFLDTTMVNVALPSIGRALGGGFSLLQWVLAAYLVTLASLVLLGGALGDALGSDRVFLAALAAFGLASLLCGVAPSGPLLVIFRLLQGAAAGLLIPGSLTLVTTSFAGEERGRAIGIWSLLSGLATVVGPLLAGILVGAGGWRWVFLINVPIAAVALFIALRHAPANDRGMRPMHEHLDLAGAACCTAGLLLFAYALIEAPQGSSGARAIIALALAVAALIAFLAVEGRRDRPMLPLPLFAIRDFAVANLATLLVYAALSVSLLLVVLQLQRVSGYSPLGSGAAIFPITLLLLVLPPRMGGMVSRMGPRRLMTLGPLVAAVGLLLFTRLATNGSYIKVVLPAAVIFGLGLAITVAPLTTTVLRGVPAARAAAASGVNNAIARLAGLLGVVIVPLFTGLATGGAAGAVLTESFHRTMLVSAVLCAAGAIVSFFGLRHRRRRKEAPPAAAAVM
jgi:EmrB/QacA subfamily drug resistance transporter